MANSGSPTPEVHGYTSVELITEQFISDLKEINQNIHNLEFDCYQVTQIILCRSECMDINVQICTYLLEFEKEISLLAPFSYCAYLALFIIPILYIHPPPPMKSTSVYNHYKERGIKARQSLGNLESVLKEFQEESEYFPDIILSDMESHDPPAMLNQYHHLYSNCLHFVRNVQSGIWNALAVFFHHRRLIRSSLDKPSNPRSASNTNTVNIPPLTEAELAILSETH